MSSSEKTLDAEQLKELDRRSERLIAALDPVANSGWISSMRPSQAVLCCIGSGPWRIERRTLIEKGALDILGKTDLTEKSIELEAYFPLAWQKYLVQDLVLYALSTKYHKFDNLIQEQSQQSAVQDLEKALSKDMYSFPKVMCMFIRDYLELPIVPRDRHVNSKLQKYGIPLDTCLVTESFSRIVGSACVNAYARALFEENSSNPQFLLTENLDTSYS